MLDAPWSRAGKAPPPKRGAGNKGLILGGQMTRMGVNAACASKRATRARIQTLAM
jgi:hypothetical protein